MFEAELWREMEVIEWLHAPKEIVLETELKDSRSKKVH